MNTTLRLPGGLHRFLAAALLLPPGFMNGAEIWKLDNLERIGGHAITVLGSPQIREEKGAKFMVFDGVQDGILVPSIPIAGARAFTVEALFLPAECDVVAHPGQKEQRFFHLEDKPLSRLMMETRILGNGKWYLDHFIFSAANRNVTLMDREQLHPTDRWFWASTTWDGRKLTSYLNGKLLLEKEGKFEAFEDGVISLGVRQNKVYWFKGAIREVRFHQEALPADKLQRVN